MSIRTDRLTKRYGKAIAVDGVSIKARDRQIYGLIGLNGAGKSTTLSMLCTLTRISSGDATVAGYHIHHEPGNVRKVVGFLPQDVTVPGHWKVLPFLRYLAALKGDASPSRLDEVVSMFGLDPFLQKKFGKLSHGQKKMILIAQAYLNDPAVILLDEPFTGLDPHYRHLIRNHIMDQRERRTQLISTHLLNEVEGIADRVGVLHEGTLLKEDDVSTITGGYVVRLRLGSHKASIIKPIQSLRAVTSVSSEGNELIIRMRHDGTKALMKKVATLPTTLTSFKRGSSLEEYFLHAIQKR